MSRFTFKEIFFIEIPANLHGAILARIDSARLARARRTITAFVLGLAASCAVCIEACMVAYQKFAASTSPQYLSLLMSDRTEVFVLWKQFAEVVAESVPLVSVTIALIALMATLYIFKKLLTTIAPARPTAFAA